MIRTVGPVSGRTAETSACLFFLVILAGLTVSLPAVAASQSEGANEMTLTLTSASFENGAEIPRRHTCEGEDLSPPLTWSGVPEGTVSLALIVDDPDAPDPAAPKMTWVHWVVYNLPATAGGLSEDIAFEDLPAGAGVGLNDWQRADYGGPCPPIGRHRYFFKLYALDTRMPEGWQPTKVQLETAIKGRVLARAELMGTYQKER
jgi:Raf kinase inhibitor-like YbhB/YbcL family protein